MNFQIDFGLQKTTLVYNKVGVIIGFSTML